MMNPMPQGQMFSPIGNSVADVFTSQQKCILMVFEPNNAFSYGIHAHRPLLYSFNDQFTDRANQAAERVARGGHVGVINDLLSDPIVQKHAPVQPAAQPDMLMDLNQLNPYYRFVLIINNPKFNGLGPSPYSPEQGHKVLVNGYFLDEPYLPHQPNVFNPNARLVFTHKTVMEMSFSSGPYGSSLDKVIPRLDANIGRSSVGMICSTPDLYYTDPSSSFDSNFAGGGGTYVSQPGHLQSMAATDGKILQTKLQDPMSNVRHLVNQIFASQREVFDAGQQGGILRSDLATSVPAFTQATMQETLARNLRATPSTADSLGPAPNEVWTMARLDAEYPSMELVPVKSDHTSMFATQDQTMNSPRVIFSELMCCAAPAILSAYGLANLAFSYESYLDLPGLNNQPYAFQVMSSMPLTNFPGQHEEVINRSIGAIHEFIRGIFSNMQQTRGDFKVNVQFDLYGMSQVYLNFNCDSQIIIEPYTSYTGFGGIIAPLFGTAQAIAHNSSEVSGLMSAFNTDRVIPGMGGLPAVNSGPMAQPPGIQSINQMVNNHLTSNQMPQVPQQSTIVSL